MLLQTVGEDESIVAALTKVELCVSEVSAWLTNNKLKLNMEKSEAIIFASVKKCEKPANCLYIPVAGH